MTTFTIEIPEKAEKTLLELVLLLGGRKITADSTVNLNENNLFQKEGEILTRFNQSVESIDIPAIIL